MDNHIFQSKEYKEFVNRPKSENHKNMTFEEEEEFLKRFKERKGKGELLSTNEIKEV